MKTTMKNNNVKLIVNLGTNPTVKNTKNGNRMACFSAAAVEPDANTGKNKVKWFNVISFGQLADVAQKHLQKGKRVMLLGNLVTREWYDKKGNVRHKHEIIATNFVLLNAGRTPAVRIAA